MGIDPHVSPVSSRLAHSDLAFRSPRRRRPGILSLAAQQHRLIIANKRAGRELQHALVADIAAQPAHSSRSSVPQDNLGRPYTRFLAGFGAQSGGKRIARTTMVRHSAVKYIFASAASVRWSCALAGSPAKAQVCPARAAAEESPVRYVLMHVADLHAAAVPRWLASRWPAARALKPICCVPRAISCSAPFPQAVEDDRPF